MIYAKLIDGHISYSPNPIFLDPYWVGNPENTPETRQMLVAEGYKPVVYTDPPETQPGYIAVPGWEETETEIVQIWTVEEVPITEEEALVRYSNELTGATDETLTKATETLIKIVKEDN